MSKSYLSFSSWSDWNLAQITALWFRILGMTKPGRWLPKFSQEECITWRISSDGHPFQSPSWSPSFKCARASCVLVNARSAAVSCSPLAWTWPLSKLQWLSPTSALHTARHIWNLNNCPCANPSYNNLSSDAWLGWLAIAYYDAGKLQNWTTCLTANNTKKKKKSRLLYEQPRT